MEREPAFAKLSALGARLMRPYKSRQDTEYDGGIRDAFGRTRRGRGLTPGGVMDKGGHPGAAFA